MRGLWPAVTASAVFAAGAAVLVARHHRERAEQSSRPAVEWTVTAPSSKSANSPPGEPHPLAVRLCTALHRSPAERMADCCGTPPSGSFHEECTRVASQALRSGAVEMDTAAVDACVRSVEEAGRGCDWVKPGQSAPPAACRGIVKGRTPAGRACRSSLECAGNLHCLGGGATTPGTCAEPEAAGAVCGTGVDVLAAYLLERDIEDRHPTCRDFCSLVTHRCEPSPARGASCRSSINCARGDGCVQGRCSTSAPPRSLAKTGEACSNDFDCAAGGCVPGSNGQSVCGKKCGTSLQALRQAK